MQKCAFQNEPISAFRNELVSAFRNEAVSVWCHQVDLWEGPSAKTCFYLSKYKASTLIGGRQKEREREIYIYNHEKANVVVSRLCFHQGN